MAVAEPGEAISLDELQLATRNRGMPLEALRYDITPVGLHYLLIHFDIPDADASTWRLRVGGNVDHPLELDVDAIRARPAHTLTVTMECAGNGRARFDPRPISQPWLVEAVSTAEWTGTPLAELLREAGIRDGTVEILFTGADRGIQGDVEHDYQRSLTVAEATRDGVLLAYEMNGRPLEPQHGFPLRLIVPGWYGMTSVKWLTAIDALTEPFEGFQQRDTYRFKQTDEELGEPVTRIRVRALMAPPGIPDFMTRRRLVAPGPVELRGRAWSGSPPVTSVEVGVDGDWSQATLEAPIGEFAWRGWSYRWDATPGDHVLSCRATDASGQTQPLEPPWNLQGMGNNLVQQVNVSAG
jgi:sulfane dehydrogenase subunit SoxC